MLQKSQILRCQFIYFCSAFSGFGLFRKRYGTDDDRKEICVKVKKLNLLKDKLKVVFCIRFSILCSFAILLFRANFEEICKFILNHDVVFLNLKIIAELINQSALAFCHNIFVSSFLEILNADNMLNCINFSFTTQIIISDGNKASKKLWALFSCRNIISSSFQSCFILKIYEISAETKYIR